MSKIIDRLIYIPRSFGDGKRYGYPEIIYVSRYQYRSVAASRLPEEIEAGRSGSYPINRCVPYTDETWYLCKQHVAKRIKLEEEYKTLEKMARRKPSTQTGLSPEGARSMKYKYRCIVCGYLKDADKFRIVGCGRHRLLGEGVCASCFDNECAAQQHVQATTAIPFGSCIASPDCEGYDAEREKMQIV